MSLLTKFLLGDLFKAAHGRYADNAKNRRLHRVGQEYGHAAQQEQGGEGRKPAQQDDEHKNPLAEKLDTLSPTQLSKLVDVSEKKLKEFKDKGYEHGAKKLEEIAREARKRLMGDEAYEKHEKEEEKKQAEQEQKEKPVEDKKPEKGDVLEEVQKRFDELKGRIKDLKKDGYDGEDVQAIEKQYRSLRRALRKMKKKQAASDITTEKPAEKPVEEPKADEKPESTGDDVKVEARMTFDDIPNSGKVKMAKYLSGARKNKVDNDFKAIKGLDDATVQTLHDGLVKKFNDGFDDMRKADRAEALYKIAKVKNELQKRFNAATKPEPAYGGHWYDGDPSKMTKDELAEKSVKHIQDFLKKNGLPVPEFVMHEYPDAKNKFQKTGHYSRKEGKVYLNAANTRNPVMKPGGMQWSYPGYKVDKTPLGVLAHEIGHHIDHTKQFDTDSFPYKDEKVTGYEPTVHEAIAESLRLFMLNPDLLHTIAPKRYQYFIDNGLKPTVRGSWKDVLHGAPQAYFDQIEKTTGKKQSEEKPPVKKETVSEDIGSKKKLPDVPKYKPYEPGDGYNLNKNNFEAWRDEIGKLEFFDGQEKSFEKLKSFNDKLAKDFDEKHPSLKPGRDSDFAATLELRNNILSSDSENLGSYLASAIRSISNADETQLGVLNKALIERGYQPVVRADMYYKMENGESVNSFVNRTDEERDRLKNRIKQDYKKLPEETQAAIKRYTGGGWKVARYDNNTEMNKPIDDYVRSTPLKEDIMLVRGINGGTPKSSAFIETIMNTPIGGTYKADGFSSFTANKLVSSSFVNSDLKISMVGRKGQKIAPLYGGNSKAHEIEFLPPTNSTFRVLQKGLGSVVIELVDE